MHAFLSCPAIVRALHTAFSTRRQSDGLVEGLRDRGHRHAIPLESPEALPGLIAELVKPGDFVVCLGAGSITYWANALPADLENLGKKGKAKAATKTAAKAKPKKGKGK